jgi:hypothetical protein
MNQYAASDTTIVNKPSCKLSEARLKGERSTSTDGYLAYENKNPAPPILSADTPHVRNALIISLSHETGGRSGTAYPCKDTTKGSGERSTAEK